VVSLGKWVQDGGLQLLDRNLIIDNVTGKQHEQSLLLSFIGKESISRLPASNSCKSQNHPIWVSECRRVFSGMEEVRKTFRLLFYTRIEY
jgi:hypothetical protein